MITFAKTSQIRIKDHKNHAIKMAFRLLLRGIAHTGEQVYEQIPWVRNRIVFVDAIPTPDGHAGGISIGIHLVRMSPVTTTKNQTSLIRANMRSNSNMDTTPQMKINLMDVLPENIEELIEACDIDIDTGCVKPVDVWMEYLATLPLSTSRENLHALNARFMPAIREYLGMRAARTDPRELFNQSALTEHRKMYRSPTDKRAK